MKNSVISRACRQWWLGILAFVLFIFAPPMARAGLTVDIHLYHDTYGYYFYPFLNANANPPAFPTGNYMIASPQIPANGSQLQYQATNNTLNYIGGGGSYYGDFDSFLYGITNGQWSIFVTNSTSTNQYKFSVTVTGVTSNSFGAPAVAVFPLNGAVNVASQPLFSWTGPTNWAGSIYVQDDYIDTNGNYNYETSANLPGSQTSWPCPILLPDGTNDFSADYSSNATALIVASTPLNNAAQPISGWVSTATLETRFTFDSQFTVGSPAGTSGGGHTLVAHYAFDDTSSIVQLGLDSSTNGNSMINYNYWGPIHTNSANAVAGGSAVQFFGTSRMICYDQVLTNLNAVLAGSFTFSAWVKTTVTNGTDGNNAYFGAVIFWAYNDHGNTNDTIPLSITGSKAAFTTRDHLGNNNTLHSITSVNDGNYHLITVTRNQASGLKKIYVDGNFETSEVGTTDALNGNNYDLSIGGYPHTIDGTGTNFSSYRGLLDDLQIYSGVLSAGEVSNLFANPGATIANVVGFSSGHTNLAYYSFEDHSLFAQDFSGKGNNINSFSYYTMAPYITNDAEAGSFAFGAAGDGWLSPPTNLLTALASSFSVSLWLKTSEINGDDDDDEFSAAGIVSAFNGSGNDVMPMGLNGSKLGFYTGGSSEDLLHSQTSINTGNYVHVVVTRNQTTGEKKIYVNGVLDASDVGSTDSLVGSGGLTIGYNNGQPFTGEMDEIQFYSGVLSASEVLQLYNHPGTVIPDLAASAANGIVAHYDFDEGTVLAPDVSGNNNNIVHASNFGGSGPSISSDTVAGSGSVSFDGGSYLTASPNLLSTLAGEFSVSLWLKTSQSFGNQNDYAWQGAGVIAADSPNGGAKDLIPVALTGGQVAFNVGDGSSDNTLNSSATVNDGDWHHVVVTRSQSTGERQIFIDGMLDSSDVASTVLLNSPVLLTIGAKSDASDPDPASPDSNGSNGYHGLLDDLQIYSRVLSSDEVTFLYNNPGATLTGPTSTPYPVDVSLQLTIVRSQDPGEYFSAGVSFNSVNPAPTTTNSVHSPNSYYNTEQYPSGGNGGGRLSSSLGEVLNECTNGLWKIYINQGSPTQQVYSFQVFVSGLDTNLLKAVKVFSPTNGAVNVAINPVFYWTGPSNFSTLQIELLSGPVAYPPVAATNWPSAPVLNYGPDRFDVDYTSNNFPGVTFTTPVDASANAIHSWTTTVNLSSESFNNFVVGAPAPLPVLITNLTRASGNLQFSFQTLAGRPHTIQARTNLTVGAWINLTNFVGDGSLKQFTFPATSPPIQFFRVNTQ